MDVTWGVTVDSSQLVGMLMDNNTGREGDKGQEEYNTMEIFRKSTKLIRSPLKKSGRTGSFSDLEVKINGRKNLKMETEGNETKKRKWEEQGHGDDGETSTARKSLIRRLKEKLIELRTEIDRDILKTVEIDGSMNEAMELVEQAEAEETVRMEEDKDGSLKQRRKINGLIAGTNTFQLFKEIEGEYWPKECFTSTTLKTDMCPIGNEDIVLWRGSDDPKMEKGFARRCRESFPELLNMSEKDWETLTLKSERASKSTGMVERTRHIHITEYRKGAELFRKLKELRYHLRDSGVKDTSMAIESDMNSEELSKMLECIFRSSGIKITMYCPNLSKDINRSQRPHQSNAIIINIKQGQYAETLKRVKEELQGGGQDTTFKRIRSTRNGEMLIELGKETMELNWKVF